MKQEKIAEDEEYPWSLQMGEARIESITPGEAYNLTNGETEN